MEPPSPFTTWVNPFLSRFISRTICFCNALAASCLTYDNTTVISLFPLPLSSVSTKPPQSGNRLFLFNLLAKGLTPMASIRDGGSIWWTPDSCFNTITAYIESDSKLILRKIVVPQFVTNVLFIFWAKLEKLQSIVEIFLIFWRAYEMEFLFAPFHTLTKY